MKRRKRKQEPLPVKVHAPAGRDKARGPEVHTLEPVARRQAHSSGAPLERETRREMEKLLEEDLGEVRIHRDSEAAAGAETLNARAYTRGRDVYFSRGGYAPESPAGRETLAHELAHVVQTRGRGGSGSGRVESPDSELEREARRAAAQVRAGRQPEIHARTTTADVLRQEKEEEAAPTLSKHPFQITPGHRRGTITAGTFSIAFRYEMAEGAGEATLVLEIPDGAEASFAPLGEMPEGGLRIDDPGGSRARTVRISASTEAEGVPRIQARFSQGAATHIVLFQLPVAG